MSAAGRQMHLGVFVLGTGNHIAGWRTEGAFAHHLDFGVMREIARIAERGKFDLLFISDSVVMDPTDLTRLSALRRHVQARLTKSLALYLLSLDWVFQSARHAENLDEAPFFIEF